MDPQTTNALQKKKDATRMRQQTLHFDAEAVAVYPEDDSGYSCEREQGHDGDSAVSGRRHQEVRNGRCSVCRYAQGGEASWFHCPHNPDGYKKESR